jgi:hypothetical protein
MNLLINFEMKKLLLLFSAGILLFSACSKDDAPSELNIDGDNNVTIDYTVSSFNVSLTSSSDLVATPSDNSWITVDLVSSGDHHYNYKVSLNENTTGEPRPGNIVFSHTGTTYSTTFNFIQSHKPETRGVYLLSEGAFGQGNGQLAYFSYNKTENKFEKDESKVFTEYGETPNDLVIYGAKIYCAITGNLNGGSLRVINPATGATIIDIPTKNGTDTYQARRIAAHGGNIYVSLYPDAVARIDTLTYNVTYTKVSGTYPEGLAVYETSLYVCNSGQGNENTVSVINLSSFTETGTINVPYNPVNIISAGNGDLYINTASAWTGPAAGTPANVHIVNASSKTVTKTFNVDAANIALGEDYIYAGGFSYTSFEDNFKKISLADKTVTDFTNEEGEDKMSGGYKLSVNPLNGDVFLSQRREFLRFQKDGTYLETLNANAANGAAAVFIIR